MRDMIDDSPVAGKPVVYREPAVPLRSAEPRDREDIQDAVSAFHEKFGYPVRTTPTVPDDTEVRFRLLLVAEEFFEMLDASLKDHGSVALAKSFVRKAIVGEEDGIGPCKIKIDMVEFTDALTDLDYVIEGTRLTFGIDGRAMLAEVHRANMAKTNDALSSADSAKRSGTRKAQKPPGWTPPDVVGVLREQGWAE